MNVSARLDPLELLQQQEAPACPGCCRNAIGGWRKAPFAFFRGAAIVQLCGDAHLLNFGFYGSPERQLLFGINDFDETHPGPFEWDVQRLAASFVLAARSLGLSEKQQSRICRRTVRAMAQMPMWVARLPLEQFIDERASANFRSPLNNVTQAALNRDSRQAVPPLWQPMPQSDSCMGTA